MAFIEKGKTNWGYIVIVVFFAILFGVVFTYKYRQQMQGGIGTVEFPEEESQNDQLATREKSEEERIGELIDDEESVNSFLFSPNKEYIALLKEIERPIAYRFPKGENGEPGPNLDLMVTDSFSIVDTSTKEVKEFDLYDLISEEIITCLKEIPSYIQFYLRGRLLKWLPEEEVFWGAIFLYSSADPPMESGVSIFKINIQDWTINKFGIAPGGVMIAHGINFENERMLYETISSKGLSLYVFDLNKEESKLLVSYSGDIFNNHCEHALDYYYHSGFVKGCDEERRLSPEWIDADTISYLDFETREKIFRSLRDGAVK